MPRPKLQTGMIDARTLNSFSLLYSLYVLRVLLKGQLWQDGIRQFSRGGPFGASDSALRIPLPPCLSMLWFCISTYLMHSILREETAQPSHRTWIPLGPKVSSWLLLLHAVQYPCLILAHATITLCMPAMNLERQMADG